MKRSLLAITFFLISIATYNQTSIKGVFLTKHNNFKQGDTISFYGMKNDLYSDKFYYYANSDLFTGLIPGKKVKLLKENYSFWEVQNFYHVSYKIVKNKGWQLDQRMELEKFTLDYLKELESNGMIYKDPFLEDYLQQLILRIHSTKFYKGRDQYFAVRIFDTEKKACYSFDNGVILITTQLLASLNTEEELFSLLTKAITHIILDMNFDNAEKYSEYKLKQLGAIYTESQRNQASVITEKYLSYYSKQADYIPFLSDKTFTNQIANVISYTAWQEYYNNRFDEAIKYLAKLNRYDIANSSDYLLISKVYRKKENSESSNRIALKNLLKATELEDQQIPEIYSELGLVYIRLKDYEKAKACFLKYQAMIMNQPSPNQADINWSLKMINSCDVHLNNSGSLDNGLNNHEQPDTIQAQDLKIIPSQDSAAMVLTK